MKCSTRYVLLNRAGKAKDNVIFKTVLSLVGLGFVVLRKSEPKMRPIELLRCFR